MAGEGIRVYCLALGGMDLTNPAGKMTMGILAAVAEFERDLLIERPNAGLIRARVADTRIGRPQALSAKRQGDVLAQLATGTSVSKLAREHNISRQTIMRLREKSGPEDQRNSEPINAFTVQSTAFGTMRVPTGINGRESIKAIFYH
ncbi:recombinase family protein [Pseudomonas fluorescens]|uniref:Resolvase/invertase-type recombinase catalytic domain-containing protein n=1 Tax=Pseudomonas fluorescens TaxID=294 RepID=A0A5E7P7D5_PSEFL|nr:recombinase family protein [Pseudomonas fluorescens]VVP43393.1 hypothetical protein PS880_04965 [Pseudomonas fluorescens]